MANTERYPEVSVQLQTQLQSSAIPYIVSIFIPHYNSSVTYYFLDTKEIEAEVFGEFWNVVPEENGEDKMVTESNQWTSSLKYRREEDTS